MDCKWALTGQLYLFSDLLGTRWADCLPSWKVLSSFCVLTCATDVSDDKGVEHVIVVVVAVVAYCCLPSNYCDEDNGKDDIGEALEFV